MAGSLLLASLTAFRSCRLSETLPKTKGDVGCRPLACTQVCSCFSAMNSVAPFLSSLREFIGVCADSLLSCLKGEQVVAKAVSCLRVAVMEGAPSPELGQDTAKG